MLTAVMVYCVVNIVGLLYSIRVMLREPRVMWERAERALLREAALKFEELRALKLEELKLDVAELAVAIHERELNLREIELEIRKRVYRDELRAVRLAFFKAHIRTYMAIRIESETAALN